VSQGVQVAVVDTLGVGREEIPYPGQVGKHGQMLGRTADGRLGREEVDAG
jgi:hypothetical protein